MKHLFWTLVFIAFTLFSTTKKENQYTKLVSETLPKEFVIVIPSYNNEKWCFRNLASVLMQKYPHFRIIYINDTSTDNTLDYVQQCINQFDAAQKITLINNLERKGACANFYYAIHTCKPNEIIIMLDGDDWLANENVLTILNQIYSDPNIWVTYGQFKEFPGEYLGSARSLPE